MGVRGLNYSREDIDKLTDFFFPGSSFVLEECVEKLEPGTLSVLLGGLVGVYVDSTGEEWEWHEEDSNVDGDFLRCDPGGDHR